MTWKHLLAGAVVLATCVVGSAYAQTPLDPATIEAAIETTLADGRNTVYLDHARIGVTYDGSDGVSSMYSRYWGGGWSQTPDMIETWEYNKTELSVDGDLNGIGDSWYNEHDNDANIAVFAGTSTGKGKAGRILKAWLKTEFAGGRHARRIRQIKRLEKR